MDQREKIRHIMLVLVFNIILPTADIGTDIRLIVRLLEKHKEEIKFCGIDTSEKRCTYYFESGEKNKPSKFQEIGLALLVPFLLNYVVCFITWFRLEKQKSRTFIVALLNLYPQFCKLTSAKEI